MEHTRLDAGAILNVADTNRCGCQAQGYYGCSCVAKKAILKKQSKRIGIEDIGDDARKQADFRELELRKNCR